MIATSQQRLAGISQHWHAILNRFWAQLAHHFGPGLASDHPRSGKPATERASARDRARIAAAP
jgi:hypothetical protein